MLLELAQTYRAHCPNACGRHTTWVKHLTPLSQEREVLLLIFKRATSKFWRPFCFMVTQDLSFLFPVSSTGMIRVSPHTMPKPTVLVVWPFGLSLIILTCLEIFAHVFSLCFSERDSRLLVYFFLTATVFRCTGLIHPCCTSPAHFCGSFLTQGWPF